MDIDEPTTNERDFMMIAEPPPNVDDTTTTMPAEKLTCSICLELTNYSINCSKCNTICCANCFEQWINEKKSSICLCLKEYVTYKELRNNKFLIKKLEDLAFWKHQNRFVNR